MARISLNLLGEIFIGVKYIKLAYRNWNIILILNKKYILLIKLNNKFISKNIWKL